MKKVTGVKKFGLVLLVMGVMVLGFGLLTASAQDDDATATVTITDTSVTMSPRTLPAGVPVTFTFTNNGTSAHAFVIEEAGADNEPLTAGGETASFDALAAGGTFSTTWTFADAGNYQLAAYNNGALESGLVVTFTVGAAQAGATASPTTAATSTAAPTAAATSAATSAVTSTTTMTTTPASGTAASTGQSPTNLPTTGGETTNWAAMLLAVGVVALIVGGALTFARRSR
jgi:LPXTG-motif cell wall-anchored protein